MGGGGGGVGGTTANGNGSLGLLASNNNGSLVIGTLGHNGGQSVQDMHRIGRETCHVTSSLDSIDKNPDIIPQDGHDLDDEWTTKGHGRTYATAAMAEQNAVITSGTYDHLMPTYAVVDKKTAPPPGHGQYIQYNTLIPVSKMGAYANQQQQLQQQPQQKTELSYSELSAPLVSGPVGVQRMAPYCSATLGRPGRQAELKRAEPNIYSQVNVMMDDEILADLQAATASGRSYVAGAVVDNIDLAHHPMPMYSTSPMFGTNSTITGVTMSHPSQLATFSPTPPPPIFTHSMVTTGDGLLQPVTCMGLVATSSAGASVPGPVPLPPQQQQQQQLTAANGGNGSIVGMGMSLYGSDVVSVSLMYFPNSWTLLLLLVDSEPVVKATLSPNVQNVESINMQSGFSGKDFWQCFWHGAGKPQLLKTVPEEVHHQLNGEDILIAQDRNLGSGTRF
ncbi:GD11515 [Drosophila simulans]|uniref:GD11515 n=1 Tax=Drosophila simulans TaxID=7240 RepID=B4QEN9_DROSI|nr:GD11515 [Drosophila simulans]